MNAAIGKNTRVDLPNVRAVEHQQYPSVARLRFWVGVWWKEHRMGKGWEGARILGLDVGLSTQYLAADWGELPETVGWLLARAKVAITVE